MGSPPYGLGGKPLSKKKMKKVPKTNAMKVAACGNISITTRK
jgi:hypothetical protein